MTTANRCMWCGREKMLTTYWVGRAHRICDECRPRVRRKPKRKQKRSEEVGR